MPTRPSTVPALSPYFRIHVSNISFINPWESNGDFKFDIIMASWAVEEIHTVPATA